MILRSTLLITAATASLIVGHPNAEQSLEDTEWKLLQVVGETVLGDGGLLGRFEAGAARPQ